MYGGLFGDLPSTKKDAEKKKDGEASGGNNASTPEESSQGSSAAAAPAKKPKAAKATGLLPRFIPTQAARPRPTGKKRPAPSSKPLATASTATTSSKNNPSTVVVNIHEEGTSTVKSTEPINDAPVLSQGDATEEQRVELSRNGATSESTASGRQSANQSEPEYLRVLHERAKENPYDPFVPNDLLQYWERKSLAKERERLMRERQQSEQQQHELRHQLEQERKQLEKSGNIDKIVEHRTQHGGLVRGRGGVSNLPAWLVAKQKKEQQERDSAFSTPKN